MGKKMNRRQWLWEFSKKIVVLVAVVYAAALLHDRIFLWFFPDSTSLPMLSEQTSEVFKATVICYAVKAGFENVTKIRKHYMEEETDERSDI